MANTTDQSHASNFGNQTSFLKQCESYGTRYNPQRSDLKIIAIQEKNAATKAVLELVDQMLQPYNEAVNKRFGVFSVLDPFYTRVLAAIRSCEIDTLVVADAASIIKKLKGIRATRVSKAAVSNGETGAESEPKTKSPSQKTFDGRIWNMDKLVELLKAQPNYLPSEADLSLDAIKKVHGDMVSVNDEVLEAEKPLNKARDSRDEIMYDPKTGLVKQALDAREYLKSVFGAQSNEYKEAERLNFRTIKRK